MYSNIIRGKEGTCFLKGHTTQHRGHNYGSKLFKTGKTIEIQLVRLTEVCGIVLSEKNAYKSVKTALLLSNVVDADHKTNAIVHHLYGF